MTQPLRRHQQQSIDFGHDKSELFDMSDPGCVSADTEYLTSTGWKRFDAYAVGDDVAQFHPDSREIEFVQPTAYIKRPCDKMIAIAPVRGTSQRLSFEHRVLYYKPDGSWDVCSAAEFADAVQRISRGALKRKFATTYSVRSTSRLELSAQELRLMVAVIADGHFPGKSLRCTVRLKKERKILRLRKLLAEVGIEYHERICGGKIPGFHAFVFQAPRHDKVFTSFYWAASQEQLEIVADEAPHWGGSIDPRPCGGCVFSSFKRESADFVQHAFSAAKRTSSLKAHSRFRRGATETEYAVHAAAEATDVGPGRETSVYAIANPEGFKYCFEVPSSFLLLRHNGHIFATGNTGKTRVAIELARMHGGKYLVLGPKSSLRSAWANDIRKFAPELVSSIAYAENRERAFGIPAQFYITNHDAAKWLARQPSSFFRGFSGLIIDESGAYKHHTSQRSKAIGRIRKHFDYCHLLNGTPNPNTILDVWHQAYILDRGQRLGKSFYAFRNAVCMPQQRGPQANMIQWTDRPGAEVAVAALLRDVTIRHKVEDCVDLPENNEYVVNFYMSGRQAKAYEDMRRTMFAELGSGTVSALNAATVSTKLLQLASGAVYENEFRYHVVDDTRNELIMDLLEPRQHSIVFFSFKHQKDQLVAAAQARGFTYCIVDGEVSQREKEQNIERFEAGFYKVAFLHPQSAAHSLTLVRAKTAIWASPTHNAEFFLQGNKRIDRIGQTERTETIVILAEGTIDERIYYDILGPKRMRLDAMLEEMRYGS